MKPDWKDAPKWANWLAQDRSGSWFWYEDEPIIEDYEWADFDNLGEIQSAHVPNWEKSKEQKQQ